MISDALFDIKENYFRINIECEYFYISSPLSAVNISVGGVSSRFNSKDGGTIQHGTTQKITKSFITI
jgi:hypothetical protein